MDDSKRNMLARLLLGNGRLGQAADMMKQDPQYQQYVMHATGVGLQPLPRTDPNWQAHFQQLTNPQPEVPNSIPVPN